MPRVSILIRVRDEARHLGATLDAVLAQETPADEVLVLDSGSTDGTQDVARARGPRVRVETLGVPFSYGRALNHGIRRLSGDLLVFLSGHSVPRDVRWLGALLAPFADARVAAVYGRQIPHVDCVPWEAYSILRAYGDAPRLQSDDPFFSNANGAVRRSAWERHPFAEDLVYAEDQLFAMQVQAEGLLVAYAPDAAVHHSHNETFRRVAQRTEQEARALTEIGRTAWPGTARALVSCAREAALRYRHVVRSGALRLDALWGPALYEIAKLRGRARAARAAACSR